MYSFFTDISSVTLYGVHCLQTQTEPDMDKMT